ncbi:hypothetical protein An13g03090 [Aspergillus niger]|uniref:Uncharacterized protein n=2 Tax=Aspergillus niger TaxID=5061 RepID=A2R205_ASPNC|nr:hypothetical protein An13g03090 [Aspergillus niger]CAK41705.1 hypothetical protein An13g03090 [Aspergillus niger]
MVIALHHWTGRERPGEARDEHFLSLFLPQFTTISGGIGGALFINHVPILPRQMIAGLWHFPRHQNSQLGPTFWLLARKVYEGSMRICNITAICPTLPKKAAVIILHATNAMPHGFERMGSKLLPASLSEKKVPEPRYQGKVIRRVRAFLLFPLQRIRRIPKLLKSVLANSTANSTDCIPGCVPCQRHTLPSSFPEGELSLKMIAGG